MGKFNASKNGYDKKEVDEYIFELSKDYENKLREQKMRINDMKRELETAKEQLNQFKERNSNISDALVVAVETAKQIENSSKNIYDLEIKRIRSLYDKWKSFLDDFMKKYPELQAKYDTKLLLKVFKQDIDDILSKNKKAIEQKEAVAIQANDSVTSNTIGLRMLINKMSNANRPIIQNIQPVPKADTPIVRNQKPTDDTLSKYKMDLEFEDETKRLGKTQIKPIIDMPDEHEGFDNLVDKFLTSDDDIYENAYSKIMFEKQKNDGFSLKEAVSPTESLDEIMKSFSFYSENKNDEN